MKKVLKLIWIDNKMQNEDNQLLQVRLKKLIDDCIFLDTIPNNCWEGSIFDQEIPPIIIVNSFIGCEIINLINYKVMIYCGDVFSHILLFLQNPQIVSMISSGINEVEQYVLANQKYCLAHNKLVQSFRRQAPLTHCEYTHSNQQMSFNFLFIHEQLKKQQQISEECLNDELKLLVGHDCFEHLIQQQKKIEKNMNLFEKLIYYYTVQFEKLSFYKILNDQMAKQNFDQLKNILVVLFEGYQAFIKSKHKKVHRVYRGMSFETEKEFQNVLQSFHPERSYFWNQLTSTSIYFETASNFARRSLFGIIFEIQLSQSDPHPYYNNFISAFKNEGEVLLFPQFEFKVCSYKEQIINGKIINIVSIKQQKNNFSMALDFKKRENYWNQRIKNEIEEALLTLTSFLKSRLNFWEKVISIDKKRVDQMIDIRKAIKQDIDSYFKEIIDFLKTLIPQQNLLDQYLNILKEETSLDIQITKDFFLRLENKLDLITKELILEFISIIKQICNLKKFKVQVNSNWSTLIRALVQIQGFDFFLDLGMGVGASFGPVGVVAGGFIFATSYLMACAAMKQLEKFKISIKFEEKHKFKVLNNSQIQNGEIPQIKISNVNYKVRSLFLIAFTENDLKWVLFNIPPQTTTIGQVESEQVFLSYIGPNQDDKQIIFQLIGLSQTYVKPEAVLSSFLNKNLDAISCAIKEIKL